MDNFGISTLLSNSFAYVLALFLLLVIFHFLLIHIKATRLNEKGWKVVDYIWLGCSAIGLIFLASEARTSLASNWLPIEQRYTDASFRAIENYAKDAEKSHYCTFVGRRTKNSPPNFASVTSDMKSACQWRKELAKVITKSLKSDHPKLHFSDIPSATFYEQGFIESELRWLEARFDEYHQDVALLKVTQLRSKKTSLELFLKLIAPILICIALALRITKVTAELKGINH